MVSPLVPANSGSPARTFVRSFNILLKYSRLYGPTHTRSATQLEQAWSDLQAALEAGGWRGLLIGIAGEELLLDGTPAGSGTAEKSLQALFAAANLSSLLIAADCSPEDFKALLAALVPVSSKNSFSVERVVAALQALRGVRINQLRFIATPEGTPVPQLAAELAARSLHEDAGQVKSWFEDPHKLLQMIVAAEGSRNTGAMPAPSLTGTGSAAGAGAAGGPGAVPAEAETSEEQQIEAALRMLGEWSGAMAQGAAKSSDDLQGASKGVRAALEQALAEVQAGQEPDRPMLLQVAEHLAIRFALDRFERGDVQVNAVREMLDRMAQQMETLRKVVSAREDSMRKAGLTVDSHVEILDRQFWAAMPEKGKRAVLLSSDAWCIPAQNVASFVRELIEGGNPHEARRVLAAYVSCVRSNEAEAQKKTAAGLLSLAELLAGFPDVMQSAVISVGFELMETSDPELQKLLSAALVRLGQQAVASRSYIVVQESLAVVEELGRRLPDLAARIRPCIGVHDRLPELVREALNRDTAQPDLLEVLRAVPQPVMEKLVSEFEQCTRREDCERIVVLAQQLGPAAVEHLREQLRAQENLAARSVGLLTRLDPALLEAALPRRLRQWGRTQQELALRQISVAASPVRATLLVRLFDYVTPVLLPELIDELGIAGDRRLSTRLMDIALEEKPGENAGYLRVKAMEALGRIRELKAEGHLQRVVEARELLHWRYPRELRLAAAQALLMLDPAASRRFLVHKGFTPQELAMGPLPRMAQSRWLRQRRYTRVPQRAELAVKVKSEQSQSSLRVAQLSLGGGLAIGETHLASGAAELDIGSGLQRVHAQVWMRQEQPNAFSFEILGINLEDRGRLRRILSGERLSLPAALFDRQSSESLRAALLAS